MSGAHDVPQNAAVDQRDTVDSLRELAISVPRGLVQDGVYCDWTTQ